MDFRTPKLDDHLFKFFKCICHYQTEEQPDYSKLRSFKKTKFKKRLILSDRAKGNADQKVRGLGYTTLSGYGV